MAVRLRSQDKGTAKGSRDAMKCILGGQLSVSTLDLRFCILNLCVRLLFSVCFFLQ